MPISSTGVIVDAYVGPKEGTSARDAVAVVEHADRIVLAVADGVTPTVRTPSVGTLDGAEHAAHTVLRQICQASPDVDPHTVLEAANAALLAQFGRSGSTLGARDRPQAAAVAAIVPTAPTRLEGVVVGRAGDCDVWVRRRDRWALKTPTPLLEGDARDALTEWDDSHPRATTQQRIEQENRVLTRSSWNVTAVGRFEDPTIERYVLSAEIVAVALVTDGVDMARFGARPPADPRDWLFGLPVEDRRAESSVRRRDDVALLHLRLV